MKNKTGICAICKETYYGWGNNAQPLIDGKCCDVCNESLVMPFRFGYSIDDANAIERQIKLDQILGIKK